MAALCHLALLGLSLWLYPPATTVDALGYQQGLFRGQFRAPVRDALDARFDDGEQVIIVGSSNALLGFRPAELADRLPGRRVHNVSNASLRMDEIRQLVQLVWSVLPPAQHAHTTFVVPLVFSSFPVPQAYYSLRDVGIAQEIRRTHAFREADGAFTPRWTGAPLTAALLLQRPLALADAWRDDLVWLTFGVRAFLAAFQKRAFEPAALWQTRPTDRLLFPRGDSADGRAINLTFFRGVLWSAGNGTLGDAQFEELRRLCRWAAAQQARLVLVAMPVPDWVRTGLPHFADYQRKIAPVLRDVVQPPWIRFVDLQDAAVPMWDATHPVPGQTGAWADALATALREGNAPHEESSAASAH